MDTTDKETALLKWGEKSFTLTMLNPEAPRNRSEFVAITVGRHASRLGFTEEELKRWLQGAYSSLWVRQSNLNPGMDMKDILKLTLRAFNNAAKNHENLASDSPMLPR